MEPLIRVPHFARLDEYAGLWAMEPTRFAAFCDMARRIDFAAHMRAEPPKLRSAIEKVPTASGKTLALVRLQGMLMKQVSSLSEATSTIQARRDIRLAAADSEVGGILLLIDSPGGSVAGTDDLAAEVRTARKSKPVWAHIDDLGASAAYWVASQAEKIFANSPTALVGSIGTISTLYDLSAAAEKEGVKVHVFATGPLKGTGVEGSPVTDEQIAYYQQIINDTQTTFDEAVSRGRRLNSKQLEAVRSGGVFLSSDAMDRKLIDGIQPLSNTIDQLVRSVKQSSRSVSVGGTLPPSLHSRSCPTMNFEQWLTAKGFDAATLGDSQRAVLTDAFLRETAPAPVAAAPVAAVPSPVPVADADSTIKAERTRVKEIEQICEPSQYFSTAREAVLTLRSEAIAGGMSVDELKSRMLTIVRASRFNAPMVTTPRPVSASDDVLEAAVCQSLRLPGIEKQFSAQTLEIAHKGFRGMGLQQLLMTVASANGYHSRAGERINSGNLRDILSYAFPDRRSEGTSSLSLSGILSNVATKELLAGYMEQDQTWREVAVIKSVPDFKQMTSYRLLDNMEYEELGPSGEIRHGKVDSESYTRQAKTYAKMFSLSRTTIINDDLGALDDLRSRIGRGAAQKFNNVFWTAFLYDHATFYTSARTNYITGSTTNLGTDGVGLGLGIKAFRQMKSPSTEGETNGKRLGGNPSILVVPPELEGAAQLLYVSTNLATASAVLAANVYINKYRPVVCSWLSDSNFTGYSTTAWYLFRDSREMAPMTVSFLGGVEAPTVESSDADFDTLGIQLRGYHDFGCDQAEYLSGIKSKGAA